MDESIVPYYAIHDNEKICGFFGPFRFLSNMYIIGNPPGIALGELYFPTTEHAYQAAKWPEMQRNQFLDISPFKAKKLGQESPKFNSFKWNKKKYEIMYELNWQKFNNHEYLKKMLLETKGFHLEERNSWGDKDWGADENGEGENNLGKILMRIREVILSQGKKKYF